MVLARPCRAVAILLTAPWAASQSLNTIEDLTSKYETIFPSGNRNAASHLWASFILARAGQLSKATVETLFRGFCPVSGSPLPDVPHTRYHSTLHRTDGSAVEGITHHCCWPCICDLQEMVRVDTATVATAEGDQQYDFLVIGDPCKHAEGLDQTFTDPFTDTEVSLHHEAPEVHCKDGKLEGAMLSDSGYPIIGMYFTDAADFEALPTTEASSFDAQCVQRHDSGYNSGMGLIFHLVASISPLPGGNVLEEKASLAGLGSLPDAASTGHALRVRQVLGGGLAAGLVVGFVYVRGARVLAFIRSLLPAGMPSSDAEPLSLE